MDFKNDVSPLVKLSLFHCGGALIIGGAFAVTAKCLSWMYPHGFLGWWIDKIELILVIVIVTALAIIFINAVVRLLASAVISIWKGFPHDSACSIVVA